MWGAALHKKSEKCQEQVECVIMRMSRSILKRRRRVFGGNNILGGPGIAPPGQEGWLRQ